MTPPILPSAYTLTSARPEERSAALQLVFQRYPEPRRTNYVHNALLLSSKGEFDPDGVWVLRRADRLIGTFLCQTLAGNCALVWPPQLAEDFSGIKDLEDALIAAGMAWLKARPTHLAESIVYPEEVSDVAPLLRHGFRFITQLSFHEHDNASSGFESLPADLRVETCVECSPEIFAQTLLRTYDGTQDVPELNGWRTLEEILAGHRAAGKYDPRYWWLIRRSEVSVGVVLLIRLGDGEDWEVSYVGIIPEFRGQGIARAVLARAIELLRGEGATQLNLAVDRRNQAALQLYRSLGFYEVERRAIFLCFMRPAPLELRA